MKRNQLTTALVLATAIALIGLAACSAKPTAGTAKGAVQLFFDALGEGDLETAYCLLSSDIKDTAGKEFIPDLFQELGFQDEVKTKHQRAFMALLIGIYNSIDVQPIEQEIASEKATVKIRFDLPDFMKIFEEKALIDKDGKIVENSPLAKLVELADQEQSDAKLCAKADMLAKTDLPRNMKLEGPIYFNKDSDGVWRLTFPEPESEKFTAWAKAWEEALEKAFMEEEKQEQE